MLRWALIFLVVALVAGVLGLTAVGGLALNIAYICAIIAVILFVWHLITGRKV